MERISKYIHYLITAFVNLGAILDTIANSNQLISKGFTFWGTGTLVVIWLSFILYLKLVNPIHFNKMKIVKLNSKFHLSFLGIILALWIPIIIEYTKKQINNYPIINIEKSDLHVKNYEPNSKITFAFTFHLKNQSSFPLSNYHLTRHAILFNNGWNKVKVETLKSLDYNHFIVQPNSTFTLHEQDLLDWNASTKGLDFSKMLIMIQHEYTNTSNEEHYFNYEYRNLQLDTLRNQIRVGIPPDKVLKEGKYIIDSLKNCSPSLVMDL